MLVEMTTHPPLNLLINIFKLIYKSCNTRTGKIIVIFISAASYQTEYSDIKYALFYLASFMHILISSLFLTVPYSGGQKISIPYISITKLLLQVEQNFAKQIYFASVIILFEKSILN